MKFPKRYALLSTYAGIATALFPASLAQAQSLVLEETIVTAERRSADLQEVPASITALTSGALEKAGIESSYDLQAAVPGLIVSNVIGFGQPAIRGIGNKNLSAAADSSVTVHVDGVYLSRPGQVLSQYFDIDRIEVVKGPQGTLYGRNAVGGTINVIHNQPTEELDAKASFQAGSYNKRRAAGMVNVPITDELYLRASVLQSNRDGYTNAKLVNNGASNVENVLGKGPINIKNVDDEDYVGYRASVKWAPSSTFDATLTLDDSKDLSNRSNVYFLITDVPNTVGAGPDQSRVVCPGFLAGTNPNNECNLNADAGSPDKRQQFLNETPTSETKEKGAAATLVWSGEHFDIKSITSYRESSSDLTHDVDVTNVPQSNQRIYNSADTFLQEIQISSNGSGPLEWVGGVFYLNDQYDQSFLFDYFYGEFPLELASKGETDAYAVFGQASYMATDKLKLTLGGRYSYEEKNVTILHSNLDAPVKDDDSWDDPTPKVGVEYILDDDIMFYGHYSKGFKSGGINTLGAAGNLTYEPEKIDAYEVGAKTTFPDMGLRINTSIFYYDYSDLQVNQVVASVEVIENAAEAEVKGFDIEIDWVITENFQWKFSTEYLDAEFTNYTAIDTNSFNPEPQNLKGNKLERAPEWSLYTSLDYFQPLDNGAQLNYQVNYSWQDDVYYTPFNKPFLEQKSYGLLGAVVTWTSPDSRWTVALAGRNLLDETYNVNTIDNSNTIGALEWLGPPREYSMRVDFAL